MKELTNKEKRILCNFVLGESNRILYPIISEWDIGVVEIRIKPDSINLNNFGGDIEKYKKCLKRLIRKLS